MTSDQHGITPLVPMPPSVRDDIMLVRTTGLVHMLDSAVVAAALDVLGMHDSAGWIQQNLASYIGTVLFGMDDAATDAPGPSSPRR